MKHILLAIQPKYVSEIKEGIKKYEFRKALPDFNKNDISRTVIVYCSSPTKAIVGEFDIEEIFSSDFEKLMRDVDASEEYSVRLKRYFGDKELCNALKIKNYRDYNGKITLNELQIIQDGFVAPQNYRYIDEQSDLFKVIQHLKNNKI